MTSLLDVIGEESRYLSNPDIASVFRAEYNERYYERTERYAHEDLFKFETGSIVERPSTGPVSSYNEQTASVIHHVLIDKITSSLINKIQSNLYRDESLRHFLTVPAKGAAAPINIQVKVSHYPNIQVVITGPFWLRFFYYGRRAFTIHGRPENVRARGRLVFYDPETLEKRTPLAVNMPAIPPGLWVEKAVQEIKSQLDNPSFLNEYFPGYEHREFLTQDLERQLNRLRTESGFSANNLLNQIKNKPLNQLTREDLRTANQNLNHLQEQSLQRLRQVVADYKAKGSPERNADKSQVYKALREYVQHVNVKVVSRSAIVEELPTNLRGRSTVRRII